MTAPARLRTPEPCPIEPCCQLIAGHPGECYTPRPAPAGEPDGSFLSEARQLAAIPDDVFEANLRKPTAGLLRIARDHQRATELLRARALAPKPPPPSYGSSPTKCRRRTKAEIKRLEEQLYDIVEEIRPATVRQVFYQAVSRGMIPKTEAAYKTIVGRLLTRLRREGVLPYSWIADNTRWMRKPRSYSGIEEMLEESAQLYRRDLWAEQDAYVEVWLEKDAVAGVVVEVTSRWDVPLMVTRGYSSLSFLASAADAIRGKDCSCHLYYLGDFDPSGVDIPRVVERRLREMAPGADIGFEVIAVTERQIVEMDLPTRPTKKTDSRAAKFRGESVEVDAIPPDMLRELVEAHIVQHIDANRYASMQQIERLERETFAQFVAGWTS